MAVLYDAKRKKFYIQYYLPDERGKLVKVKIRNSLWGKDLGKKYIKSIEHAEIELDQQKRGAIYRKKVFYSIKELCDDYLSNEYKIRKADTAYYKKLMIKNYVLPVFNNNLSIDQSFNEKSIENFRSYILNNPKIKTIDYKNHLIRLMRQVVEYAFRRDKISQKKYNQAIFLLPNFSENNEVKKSINFWTYEERCKFLSTFDKDDPWRLLFEVCYYGALRIGELLGLKWKNVSFENKTIYIENQRNAHGNTSSLKTASSKDNVDLPTQLMDELKAYKDVSIAQPDEYLFFLNHPISRTTVTRKMDRHIEIAKVKHITKHGLRHSCASMLINNGVNILYISKHLRHKSTQQTLDTYSHLFPSTAEGIMDKLTPKITPKITPKN